MIKDLLKKGNINLNKQNLEEKYLSHKQKEPKESTLSTKVHKSLDEELKPLTMINQSVGQLNGVKGLFIQEIFMLSNMFSWNTSNVFEIHEGDAKGNRLDPNSKPILYAVAKLQECCTCNYSEMGASQIAVTTQLNDAQSSAPYLYLKEVNTCCGFNSCQIFINENGNGTQIGNISQGCRNSLVTNSSYLHNLSIYQPCCQSSCSNITYSASDSDNNKGVLVQSLNCCSCNNPYNYKVGFPPNYDTDQKTLFLASVIFLGYLNYQTRNSSSSSNSSH